MVRLKMKIWTTQKGDEIKYKNLEDDHLLNILAWIKRRAENGMFQGVNYYDGDDDFMTGDMWARYH